MLFGRKAKAAVRNSFVGVTWIGCIRNKEAKPGMHVVPKAQEEILFPRPLRRALRVEGIDTFWETEDGGSVLVFAGEVLIIRESVQYLSDSV